MTFTTCHASEPSIIAMSTNCPLPVSSRAQSAERMPTAAMSAPPPMSAICTAGMTGAPPAAPVHPIAIGAVLAVARDRAVDEAGVHLAERLPVDAEPRRRSRPRAFEDHVGGG